MRPYPFLSWAAALGWAGLAVQVWLVLLARWQADASLMGGLVSVFTYFTVLTNTLVATVFSYAAWGQAGAVRRWFLSPAVTTAVGVSIVMVAMVYTLLLRNLWQPEGWQWLADVLLHNVMPLLFVVYWWRAVPKGRLRVWHLVPWSLYPAGYFAYALWRGFEIGLYPYPFIDVAKLGYAQVMLNALAVLAGFWVTGLVFIAVDRWQGARAAAGR